MAAPKTETKTASAFSRAGPVAAHDTARKVILAIVSPDVTEHSLKVHFAPLRLPVADRYIIVGPHLAAAPTVPSHQRSRMQGASNLSAVRGVMRGGAA
jgi:hypothetical protein